MKKGFVTVSPTGLDLSAPRPKNDFVELPPHGANGYLPPHVGDRFVVRNGASPYRIGRESFVDRFGGTAKRKGMIDSLFAMLGEARGLGVETGFTWIGGSFVDLREEPNDLDVVTFYVPTPKTSRDVVRANPRVFQPTAAKESFGCDAYFLPLVGNRKSYRTVSLWYALFSHDRETLTWKGFVELSL